MKIDTIEFIRWLSIFSFVGPIIFYAVRFSDHPRQNHIVAALILVCGLMDILLALEQFSLALLCNIQDVLQFLLMTILYYELIYKKRSEYIMHIGIGIYATTLLACIFKMGFFQNYIFLWSASSVILTAHGLIYIFNVQTMVIDRYFDSNFFSNMIFNASFMCYFLVTIIIFLLAGNVFETASSETIDAFWSMHNIFNIFKNIGLALGFYFTGKRKVYMTMQQLEKIAKKLEEEKMI